MNVGWEQTKLSDVILDIKDGGTPSRSNPSYFGGDICWCVVKDIKPFIYDTVEKLTREGLENSSAKVWPIDSVIISLGATIGQIGIAKVPTATKQGLAGIVVNPQVLKPEFLAYALTSQKEFIQSLATGATIKEIRPSRFAETIRIPTPPLSEQQRIVCILDKAFEAITAAKANAEKNLQNARAAFESQREAIFSHRGEGWLESPLSELCDIKHGFAFKSEFFTSNGEYVLLTPGNFYETGGYRDRGEKQKYYSGEVPHGYVLGEGDLLVAMTEQAAGLLGSPVLVPESNRFLHNQRLGLVTGKPGVPWANPFFFHAFNTRFVRKEIHDNASGVKVRHTSPGKIGEVPVCFPASIEAQKDIAAKLDAVRVETRRLESVYDRKTVALDGLKKSFLAQAFSGQL